MRLIQISSALSILVIVAAVFLFEAYGHETKSADNGSPASKTEEKEEDPSPHIVCLGDSYTYGYPDRTPEADSSWPHHMEEILGVKVANEGKLRQTSADLLERFDSDVVGKNKAKPAMVIIFAGMGDALGETPASAYTFEKNVVGLVEKAQDHDIKPVLIMPFFISEADILPFITEYRDWLRGYAETNDIKLIDFQEMLCDGENGIKKQYSPTGKYPNTEGYLEMGKYMAEQLKNDV
jgi:lysophospholipase L1-like esterase